MSNAKIRFELRLATGFSNIWGFFDTKEDRFVKKEDGYGIPIRVSKEERGALVIEQLNAAHAAAEKLRQEQEFEASAPKVEAKSAPLKRTAPKVTKAKTEPKPAPAAETKPTRRKKAA